MRLVFYGYLIMLYLDVLVVTPNFGSAGESIIVGKLSQRHNHLAFCPYINFNHILYSRSCGHIFCADCSEFWAPLPDEHLYTPVRLCGPCYHAVTTKSYEQNSSSIHASMSSSNHVRNSNSHCLSNPSTSSTTLEPCKNAMVTSKTDQSPTKATTVMN